MSLKITTPPTSLRELCLAKMKEAIFTGYLPSGMRLVERSLCEELGVSRSVVREVIRYLEAEGLVEVIPNKGPIVATLNWDKASQIYDIRLLLEQNAVAQCIKFLTKQAEQSLKKSLKELESAFQDGNTNKIIEQSTKLYGTIFMTAKQEIAWEIVQQLNGRISRLRALTMNSKNREITGYERIKTICEAIYIHKDPALAQKAVQDHIEEAARIAQNILTSHNSLV